MNACLLCSMNFERSSNFRAPRSRSRYNNIMVTWSHIFIVNEIPFGFCSFSSFYLLIGKSWKEGKFWHLCPEPSMNQDPLLKRAQFLIYEIPLGLETCTLSAVVLLPEIPLGLEDSAWVSTRHPFPFCTFTFAMYYQWIQEGLIRGLGVCD